jgi:hypothetical protein
MTLESAKEFGAIHQHKYLVLSYLTPIIQDLIKRAAEHDNSKFSEEEFPGLVGAIEEFKKVQYGTPEYMALREKYKPTFDAHYRKNRHHPEFHQNGIEDMDLIDLVEMVCDWKAASMRAESGNIANSIKIGSERYNIPPVLVKILENTARNYKL